MATQAQTVALAETLGVMMASASGLPANVVVEYGVNEQENPVATFDVATPFGTFTVRISAHDNRDRSQPFSRDDLKPRN